MPELDRSPGEFYQLDFEMSFATQEDVFRVGEEVLSAAFEKFAPEGYAVTKAPYPVISYRRAMLEFGTDKPDLRNPLRIIDLTDFFQACMFKPFHNRTVRAIKVHAEMSKGFHEKLLKFATDMGMGGLGYLEVAEDLSYKDRLISSFRRKRRKSLQNFRTLPWETRFSLSRIRKRGRHTMRDSFERNLERNWIYWKRTRIASVMSMIFRCLRLILTRSRSVSHTILFPCRREV